MGLVRGFINRKKLNSISALGWLGSGILLVAPYMIHINLGYYLLIIGIGSLIPQCYKAKQWNLVILNMSSMFAYTIHLINI